MLERLKNKKCLLALTIIGFVFIFLGTTLAWFSYGKFGIKQHTITSGAIKFHYQEGEHRITLNDAMPMTDAQGMATDYFEFSIDSKTSDTVDIPYYITARRSGTGTNMDSVVKVYLTKVVNGVEQPIEVVTGKTIAKVSELGNYVNNDGINIPNTEHLLHTDKVFAGTSNYNQVYRLRMWIDDKAEFIIQQEGEEDIYPYNGKTYTLTVNVYSSGVEVNQSTVELRANPNLNNIQIDNNLLTTSTNTFEGNVEMPIGETNIDKNIMVNAENSKSTARVRKVASGATLSDQQVNDVTQPVTVNLTLGENDFDIDVTSEDKRIIKEYDLILRTAYPSYEATLAGNHITFENDSIYVDYGNTNTVTLEPELGYYINNGSCSNGYTISGLSTGTTATGSQTITIYNNNQEQATTCTFNVTPLTYSITYNLNGGTNPNGTVTSYTKETNTFSLSTPTKTGYTFKGWYENSGFTGSQVTQIAKGSTGNKTYYAKWEIITYKDSSGANYPELFSGMIPVYYNNGNTMYANVYDNWYDYNSHKWANAVLVDSTARSKYINNDGSLKVLASGTQIPASEILQYYVWIPRYKYQLFNINTTGFQVINPQIINVTFETGTATTGTGSTNGTWLTHPAFTFGSTQLKGIWVGKFETSYADQTQATTDLLKCTNETCTNANNLRVLPNMTPRFDNNLGEIFYATRSIEQANNAFGLKSNEVDTRVIKNMDWGAVAYLNESKYGLRNTNGTCTNEFNKYNNSNSECIVWINRTMSSIAGSSTVTGCSCTDIGKAYQTSTGYSEHCGESRACEPWNSLTYGGRSATGGTMYGIYDMSGGDRDAVLTLIKENSTAFDYSSYGFVSQPASKYMDVYTYSKTDLPPENIPEGGYSDYTRLNKFFKLGDATKETIAVIGHKYGYDMWYQDYTTMAYIETSPSFVLTRGDHKGAGGASGGIYSLSRGGTELYDNVSYRIVISAP